MYFPILKNPDYNSTAVYANCEKNYWPDGSSAYTDTSRLEKFFLNPDGSYTIEAREGKSYH